MSTVNKNSDIITWTSYMEPLINSITNKPNKNNPNSLKYHHYLQHQRSHHYLKQVM